MSAPPGCPDCPLAGAGPTCPAVARNHPRFCELHAADPDAWGPHLVRMAEGGAPEPAAPPALPSLRERVKSLAGALKRWHAAGRPVADKVTVAARLASCRACPALDKGVCRACGCFVAPKARIHAAGTDISPCPLSRWPGEPRRGGCGCGG